jgi:tetratricopeptide (TPR) repeat protein
VGFNAASEKASGSPETAYECALESMRSGRYAPALRCLSDLTKESPALFFNLALCFIQAEDFQSAQNALENSLKLIKKTKLGNPSSHSAMPQPDQYKKLREKEISNAAYLSPMAENFPLMFTVEAEEDIIMSLAFVYKKIGQDNQAKTMAAALKGEQFAAFKKEHGV